VFSQARHGAVLLLAAAIIGVGLGSVTSSGQTLVAKITSPHRLGLANSTFLMLADVGVGIGPLLCGLLIPLTGYRGMYVVMAAESARATALGSLFEGDARWRRSEQHVGDIEALGRRGLALLAGISDKRQASESGYMAGRPFNACGGLLMH